MAYKTANQCTYHEMMGRFNSEINRAIQYDWHPDLVGGLIENRIAFMAKYRGMRDRETIIEFELRNSNPTQGTKTSECRANSLEREAK